MQACDEGEYDQLAEHFPLCVWQAYLNDDIPLRGFVDLETVISRQPDLMIAQLPNAAAKPHKARN